MSVKLDQAPELKEQNVPKATTVKILRRKVPEVKCSTLLTEITNTHFRKFVFHSNLLPLQNPNLP